ncbi:heterokaryon incompatibility protein-domain-containing protein, partial [Pyrenochaeta sp. MPI-SDFR-AT-0127]
MPFWTPEARSRTKSRPHSDRSRTNPRANHQSSLQFLSDNDTFRYAPLHPSKRSIRILKVLPGLFRGELLQCELVNCTTDYPYTCLSYTWGECTDTYHILINRQPFFVRSNVWDFLRMARTKYPQRPFWIDAICIDQTNVEERNSQVAEMGAIYSNAMQVITWLGKKKAMADFFQVWHDAVEVLDWNETWNGVIEDTTLWKETMAKLSEFKEGWCLFTEHAYWTRAWVTQEIALAKRVVLLAGDVELDISLCQHLDRISCFPQWTVDARFRTLIEIALIGIIGIRRREDESLVSLLEKFPNQHCSVVRDRVYSLRWLSIEGKDIVVDYNLSEPEFMFDLAGTCRKSM